MMERKRYDSIQALRALAALCVVLCHIEGSVGGQFGVDIFMCITGFMIAYTTDGSACAGEFLRHRAVRILPLYYAVTVLTYISALAMPSLFWTTVATAGAGIFFRFFRLAGQLIMKWAFTFWPPRL